MRVDELPPPVQMTRLLAGFQLSQALYAAAVLGVADRLVAGFTDIAVRQTGTPFSVIQAAAP